MTDEKKKKGKNIKKKNIEKKILKQQNKDNIITS